MAADEAAASTSNSQQNGEPDHASKRGIPPMKFIESVEDYMLDTVGKDVSVEESVQTAVKSLEELYQKYKYAEANMYQQKSRLKQKLPELRNSLDLLAALEQKRGRSESTTARFLLSDQCFATAELDDTDAVNLWLGANVMLEYPIGEARQLLSTNLRSAEKNIEELSVELEFVKDQITTSEVNMARVYNWGVQKRKANAPASSE